MRFSFAMLIFAALVIFVYTSEDVRSDQSSNSQQVVARETGRELDIMIKGKGFLQVLDDTTGEIWYTRNGHLDMNADGDLVVGSATTKRLLEPAINVPKNATDISISTDGQVWVKEPGTTQPYSVGQLELATFDKPNRLLKVDEHVYRTDQVCYANMPGENTGTIVQGVLEILK